MQPGPIEDCLAHAKGVWAGQRRSPKLRGTACARARWTAPVREAERPGASKGSGSGLARGRRAAARRLRSKVGETVTLNRVNRRDFVRLAGAAMAPGANRAAAQPSRAARMKVGTQHGDSDPILRAMANEAQGFAFALGYIKALIAAVSD